MRFRFCGDLDAPDWLLAEIATLSKISSVRMKLIAKQVLLQMVGGAMDYEKVLRLLTPKGAARPSVSDTKGLVAALEFVVENAAKHEVDEGILHGELQQLGLPKENCDALSRQYRDNRVALRAKQLGEAYEHSRLLDVDWRVDTVLADSTTTTAAGGGGAEVVLSNRKAVQLNFVVDTAPHEGPLPSGGALRRAPLAVRFPERVVETACELSPEKLEVLLYELRSARVLMGSLDETPSPTAG